MINRKHLLLFCYKTIKLVKNKKFINLKLKL
jgi:hypothetical protein